MSTEEEVVVENDHCEEETDHDPHFEPIISLPEVTLPTLEEEETEMIKMRAKLFRYDTNEHPPEWKERGTGDVKLLLHKDKNSVRVLMRRDKTLKICANHFVTPYMELKPNCGSDRAWVWSVIADFADETAKPELLAIRFANADNAKKWKEAFEEAKLIVKTKCKIYTDPPPNIHSDSDAEDNENDDSSESSDEENLNNTINNSAVTETETTNVAANLHKLNINEENIKVLNTDHNDVNKNKNDSEKTNSTIKSIR